MDAMRTICPVKTDEKRISTADHAGDPNELRPNAKTAALSSRRRLRLFDF